MIEDLRFGDPVKAGAFRNIGRRFEKAGRAVGLTLSPDNPAGFSVTAQKRSAVGDVVTPVDLIAGVDIAAGEHLELLVNNAGGDANFLAFVVFKADGDC